MEFFNFDLTSAKGIYTTIAICATVVAFIMMLVSFVFDMDHGGDVDASGHETEASFFSIRSILGFLLGFGWGGLCSVEYGIGVSIAVGLGVGVVMFLIVALLMRFVMSLRSSGNIEPEMLVGKEALVYVTVPGGNQPGGQIKVATPAGLLFYPAVYLESGDLSSGTPVVIEKMVQGKAFIRPLT